MVELKIALEVLHRCEKELAELARQLRQVPAEIEAAETRAVSAREAAEAERARLEQAEHNRREKEAELQDCEARRAKYLGQTALVKTNTEYTALLTEIDSVTARISAVEEEILQAMEESEGIGAGLEAFERAKKQEEEAGLRAAEDLRQRLVAVEKDIEAHESELERLLSDLPPNARTLFERTRKTLGSGTTTLQGRACASCHRDVPYETINRLIASEFHSCPNCRRILVVTPE